MYKFHPDNIHLQTAWSNSWGDKDDWKQFEQELTRRYGDSHLSKIEEQNKATEIKITTQMVMEDIERKIALIATLPEKPKYWTRLMMLREKVLTPLSTGNE